MDKKLAKLLGVIFVVFLLLFHFPIISIANVSAYFNGIPSFFIYLFSAWAALVLVIFFTVKKIEKHHGD